MTHARTKLVALATTMVIGVGCGGDRDDGSGGAFPGDGGDGGSDDGGGTGDGGGSDGTGGGDGGDGGDGTGGDGGSTGDPDEGNLAEGIRIDQVEFNQGAGVVIIREGAVLPEGQRAAPLIGGRGALVRVFWEIDPDFDSREIEARLQLLQGDGTPRLLTQTKQISGPPSWESLDGSFNWEVAAEDLDGDTEISIGLFEIDGSGGTPEVPPRIPAEGTLPLEAIGDAVELRVVIIPATLDCLGVNPPTIGASEQAIIESQLLNFNPINSLDISYHDPMTLQQASYCSDGYGILDALTALRNQENLGPNVHYHAIFDNAAESSMEDGGRAWLGDETMGCDRVSYSVNWPGNMLNNVAHEIGHTEGRPHTFEDGEYVPSSPGSPDCGRRSTWGYGLFAGQHPLYDNWSFPAMADVKGWLVPPTEGLVLADYCYGHDDDSLGPALNDMMSYAAPYWISAYTLSKLAVQLQLLSSWDEGRAVAEWEAYLSRWSLHGHFLGDEIRWHVMRGHPRSTRPLSASDYARVKGVAEELPVAAKRTGDGRIGGVVIPLPAGVEIERAEVEQLALDGVCLAPTEVVRSRPDRGCSKRAPR